MKAKRTGDVAHMVEHLPNKCQALSSNSSSAKNKPPKDQKISIEGEMEKGGNPCTSFVGIQIKTAIVENSVEVPQKIKIRDGGVAQAVECCLASMRP
jgi:hypothetical protein